MIHHGEVPIERPVDRQHNIAQYNQQNVETKKVINYWFSRRLDCPDKGFAFSSHPMTCFVLRHHVDGVHTVVHPCCASQNWNRLCCDQGMWGLANCKLHFLAPHPSTFGLFGNASINLVLNVAFFSCFHTGNTILGGPPKK